jgi:hypothetical protein
LLWSIAASVASIGALVADENVEAAATRHEIRHVLSESPGAVDEGVLAYFDSQWRALGRMSLWHAATSIILGVLSAWALAKCKKEDVSLS